MVIKNEDVKPATINPDLLVRFVDFAQDLYGKRQVPQLLQRGTNSALVSFSFENKLIYPNLTWELLVLVLIILLRSFLVWFSETIAIKSATIAKSQLRTAVMKHAQALGPVAINKFRANKLTNT